MRRSIQGFLARLLPGHGGETCPGCGSPFRCGMSLKGCWCRQIELSPGALKQLRSRYQGCLCRDCLQKAAVDD